MFHMQIGWGMMILNQRTSYAQIFHAHTAMKITILHLFAPIWRMSTLLSLKLW
jgi:hypothetical protein